MAELTLLQISQEFCRRSSLPQPTTVVGALDDTTQQILGLLNEGAQDIGQRYNLPALSTMCTFQHANGPSYKALDLTSEAAVPGFKFMVKESFWNNSNRLPMGDPTNDADWQFITIMGVAAALYRWKKYGNALYIYPVPNPLPSVTWSFFYQSRFSVFSPIANAFTLTYVEDGSYPRYDSELVLNDIKWRWKRSKGLPYAEDMRTCESQLMNMVGRDPAPALVLDGDDQIYGAVPALYIPVGNWPHP